MLIANAAEDASKPKPHEHQICEGVDDFSGVFGGIVVLESNC